MQKLERKNVEILAPAGNMEALICAINNGANAVYLGLKQFNARAKAGNFTYEELLQAVKYAHFYGVRIYLTFNVLYKKTEYSAVLEAIKKCKEIGVDAFILQDFAFISYLKSNIPDIIIHLSTQAGIHNLEGAIFAEKLGANRIILSRETLLDDIKEIKKHTTVEIECFVQGALCIGFSGNCYFSSIVSGYSGNRGKCLQLCRKKYTYKGRQAYWLSPKDINLSSKVNELVSAGVTSFKIEGRMRRPEYVGEAVNCYKTVLDGKKYDESRLKRMFNRGDYTKVYIDSPKANVIYEKTQNHIGFNVGKVINVNKNRLTLSCNLTKGDGIKIFRNNDEAGTALVSNSGSSTTYVGNVKVGDYVNLTTDVQLNSEVTSVRRFVNFDLEVKVTQDYATFSMRASNLSVSKKLENPTPAINSALTKEQIIQCFAKTNDYNLRLENANVDIDFDIFITKSNLNEIRRELCNNLTEKINLSYKYYDSPRDFYNVFDDYNYFLSKNEATILQTNDIDTANLCHELCDYVAYFPKRFDEYVINEIKRSINPVLLVLPNIARGEDVSIIKHIVECNCIENVIINNVYGLEIAKNKKILLGPMMNVICSDFNYPKILSVESSDGKTSNDFVYVYGNFPLMTYCHCPLKAYHGKCINCDGDFDDCLIDERGNSFKIYPYKIYHCYSYLLNDRPINLTGLSHNFKKKFIDLIGVDQKICYNILSSIKNNQKIHGGTLAYYNKNLE